MNIKVYDNGGESLDRYSVIYLDDVEGNGLYGCRAMNAYPFHPQGIGMYCMAKIGKHLGKEIKFEQLPEDCQKVVKQDLELEETNE